MWVECCLDNHLFSFVLLFIYLFFFYFQPEEVEEAARQQNLFGRKLFAGVLNTFEIDMGGVQSRRRLLDHVMLLFFVFIT